MRRFVKRVLVIALISATPLAGYLWHYHALSNQAMKQCQLDGEETNALKHALAAAQLFQALNIFISTDDAEKTIVWLGRMNEYAEQWFHAYPKERAAGFQPDTTIEIIKDLHNNYVGIAAAQWQAAHAPDTTSSLDIIARLVKTDAMVVWANTLKIPQSELDAHVHDVGFAAAWVEQRRADIMARTEKTLTTLY